MVNSVSLKQNLPEQLNCLAAQRTLYSIAKKFTHAQIFLSVPVIIIISVAVSVISNPFITKKMGIIPIDISWVAAAAGVIVTLLDLFMISPTIDSYKEKGAKIQELFDVTVLNLPWNDIAAGNKPDHEEIIKYSQKIKQNQVEFNQLRDWYSTKLSNIPLSMCRIICQRSNLSWDTELRKSFSKYTAVAAFVLTSVLFFIGLLDDLTIKKFFLVVFFPALPIIVFSARQWLDNKKAIKQLNLLKDLLNITWTELLSGEKSESYILGRSRSLQDQIYVNRRSNPLILDWYYNFQKSRQHQCMYYSIDQMIEEYTNS